MHLSLLMYDTVNRNVPSYLGNPFSNACENNPYKSKLTHTEYNVVLDHVPETEYYKGSFSYRGGIPSCVQVLFLNAKCFLFFFFYYKQDI